MKSIGNNDNNIFPCPWMYYVDRKSNYIFWGQNRRYPCLKKKKKRRCHNLWVNWNLFKTHNLAFSLLHSFFFIVLYVPIYVYKYIWILFHLLRYSLCVYYNDFGISSLRSALEPSTRHSSGPVAITTSKHNKPPRCSAINYCNFHQHSIKNCFTQHNLNMEEADKDPEEASNGYVG